MWLYKGIQYIVTPSYKHTFYMHPTAWLYRDMTISQVSYLEKVNLSHSL